MRTSLFSVTALALTTAVLGTIGCSSEEAKPPTTELPPQTDPSPGVPPLGGAESEKAQDPNFPRVKIETTAGDIVVELNAEKANITAKNFLFIANNGHYDRTIFHQVVEGYIVLGGGYSPDLKEKANSFYPIRNEADNGLKNERGTIAMARLPDAINSSTNQFYFNLNDNPGLDHVSRDNAETYGYCVFGRVLSGMEVLDAIAKAPVNDRDSMVMVPVEPVVIKSVRPVY